MMRRFFVAAALFATLGAAGPAVSSVLAQLRYLSDSDFVKVTHWAKAGGHDVRSTRYTYQKAEYAITQLDRDTQYAVVRWLSGNGRKDLYNIKITDADIGPERDGADRYASDQNSIYGVLDDLSRMSNVRFMRVALWARDPANPTYNDSIEARFSQLDPDERNAILRWLRGEGRDDLYDLNLTDNDISRKRVGADYPFPIDRELRFVKGTLSQTADPASNVSVYNGFGTARLDESAVMACLSFRVNGQKTATRVVFNLELTDASGAVIGNFIYARQGKFTGGISINGLSDYDNWIESPARTGLPDNCGVNTSPLPASVVAQTLFLTPLVMEVDFDDGTAWIRTK